MKKLMVFFAVFIGLFFIVSCEIVEDGNGNVDENAVNEVEDDETVIDGSDEIEDDKADDTVVHKPSEDDIKVEGRVGFAGITKQQCQDAGGYWNECGSPCAGTGADFCIEMCQVQCECGGIAGFGCPDGFKCRLSGKIADEMGVCVGED